ncbi:sirohydrochlorin chelatase [Litchfieldia alkalitelluris]|uniref:sirohydrochlorin chelatase n=1 Tax=Litchfieldia alkalitelluris TaxID=304268 RepID=UPI000996D99B|nr:sirohydrochlorin chelatase [Litchfieldia alkalitelluris]
MEALIYAGHGSRTESGNSQFISFVKEMMMTIDVPLQGYGFLEGARPSILEAISMLVSQGATSITIMPILLLTGAHANQDIPGEIFKAQKIYPRILFYYGKPFGCDEMIIEILHDRLSVHDYKNKKFKSVLLVSHGSYDKNALSQFEEIAQKLRYNQPFDVLTCYLNMSTPTFSDELENVLKQTYEEVYVIPYLLFSGGFTVEIENITESFQKQFPGKKIFTCEPIGFDVKLKKLFTKRIQEVQPLIQN